MRKPEAREYDCIYISDRYLLERTRFERNASENVLGFLFVFLFSIGGINWSTKGLEVRILHASFFQKQHEYMHRL